MSYKIIESKKIILSALEFKNSKQGGYYSNEAEVCKIDFNLETIDQKEKTIKNIFSWLDCEPQQKTITKILKDLDKNGYTIFEQIKPGLKLKLLKRYSLKIETTTNKQFQLL
jgi:RNA binding exosome subunit